MSLTYERGKFVQAATRGDGVTGEDVTANVATVTEVPKELARAGGPYPEVLEVRRGAARLSGGAGLDLGGIAKGWMADRLSERLGRNVLANLGGDLRARGDGPDGAGWPVGIAGQAVLLQDQGAATSSVRRRRWGDGLHHLVDPARGLPAETCWRTVSVAAGSCAECCEDIPICGGTDLCSR